MMDRPTLSAQSCVRSVIHGTNAALLAEVSKLWIDLENDIVLDATAGKLAFWRKVRPVHLIAHDLDMDGVDLRSLPEASNCVDVLVLDPPYATSGSTGTSTTLDYRQRYGLDLAVPIDAPAGKRHVSPDTTLDLYRGGILEAARVLKKTGRLLIKCQAAVYWKELVPFPSLIWQLARGAGFRLADEFVLESGLGPQPLMQNGKPRQQYNSRKIHSVLQVYVKGKHRWPSSNFI
jgi:hypothetical protein